MFNLTIEEQDGVYLKFLTNDMISCITRARNNIDLSTCVQRDLSFFPPVIIAHGFCTNVAEKYIESHPASGLVLVAPMNAEQASKIGVKELAASTSNALEGSKYEPLFPILLISNSNADKSIIPHRLLGDPNVDHIELDYGEDHNGMVNGDKWKIACQSMATWLDDMGF